MGDEKASVEAGVDAGTLVRPGALTQLLADLARAPEAVGWDVPLSPGDRVGRYEVVRELGRGGFGVVYEARDSELGRSVALKTLRAARAETPEGRRRLAEAEAEAGARLAHPNIVHLYDVGRAEQGAFLVMELLQGRTLAARLAEGPLSLREAVRMAVEAARGVAHAHSRGVVHRDLKPSNVFVCDDGQVKVLDFGLASVLGQGGVEGGTPAYMAPEQRRGEPGDERADVYSLGLIVAELTGGVHPPQALQRLVARMREEDPTRRPATAGAALVELAAVQRSLEPRRWLWASAGIAAAALAGAATFAWTWQRPMPEGRLLTAIADTDNQTGDPDLGSVSELLRAGLEQSRRVSIMARSRLAAAVRARGEEAPAFLGEAAAGGIARAASAALLMVPSIRPKEAGFEVQLRAIDLARDRPWLVVRDTAGGKATVPAALDRLALRVRRALREEPGQASGAAVPVGVAASASPEAIRHYQEGLRLKDEWLWKGGDREKAKAAWRRAIEADPGFLHPRMELIDWPYDMTLPVPERQAHEKAIRDGLHRLPEPERPYAEYLVRPSSELESADRQVAFLDRAVQARPEDPRPYVRLAQQLLVSQGDVEAARPYVEKALELGAVREDRAVRWLLDLGRGDEALVRARRLAERLPGWRSYLALADAWRSRGAWREALDATRRAQAFRAGTVLTFDYVDADAWEQLEADLRGADTRHWSFLAEEGRFGEALRRYDAETPPDDGTPRGELHWQYRIMLLVPLEDPEVLLRDMERAVRRGFTYFGNHATALALLGDVARAERMGRADGPMDFSWHRLRRAVLQWKRGDPEGALRALESIHAPSVHLARAQILLELGRNREALDAVARYRRERYEQVQDEPAFLTYPRSLYLEAVALDQLGDRDEGRRALGKLLRLWRRADPDLPLLRRARALDARLAAAGGRE